MSEPKWSPSGCWSLSPLEGGGGGVYRGGSRISEGGASGSAWRMAVAAGRVPLKLLPCVLKLNLVFAPFHSCQIFLACVFRELVILMRDKTALIILPR